MGAETNQNDYGMYAAAFAADIGAASINAADSRAGRKWASQEAEENRDFQLKMYDRQLSDSIAWRDHAEKYNSPAAQMQRYADAGINPMYFVTGSSNNSVITNPTVGGSFGANPPSPSSGKNYQLNFMQAKALSNQTKLANADLAVKDSQADANKALASMYQADAREKNANAAHREFENEVDDMLRRSYIDDRKFGWSTYNELRAQVMLEAESYKSEYQGLAFDDAKAKFIHSKEVRKFELDLQKHQRKLFEQELSKAKSAAQIFAVQAKWAVANQAIGAVTDVLGAAAGLLGAAKGTAALPTYSNSRSENYSESYNESVTNRITLPEGR